MADIDTNQIEEGSAAETLKPGAGSNGGDSKAETLATFTSLLAQLGKEDLSNLFNRTLEQIGKEAATTPGSADANRATVAMKPSSAVGKGAWKEDIDDMFGGDELTEELREKASTIFEAAVNTRITLEEARLQDEFDGIVEELEEQFADKLQEQANGIFEDVANKLDMYLDYVVEQWMETNAIAVETSLRADIAENFIQALHQTFAEHYISVPEEKIDLVAELKTELDNTKARLSEALDEKIELSAAIEENAKIAAFETVAEGLAETQVEKLRTLSEGIEFSDAGTFQRKLEIIRENYFTKRAEAVNSTGLITEEIDGSSDGLDRTEVVPANMNNYVKAISKSVK